MKEEIKKPLNIYQRINQVMSKVSSVARGSHVQVSETRSYTATSHDDVTALLHGPITEAGIFALPDIEKETFILEPFEVIKVYSGREQKSTNYLVKLWATVTFINVDNPEDRVTTKCFAYAFDSSDKATGKAYSMAVKYCYLKTFMLESFDDEESRENEKKTQPPPQEKKEHHWPTHQSKPNTTQQDRLASDNQKKALVSYGIKFNENITMQEASKLIGDAKKRG